MSRTEISPESVVDVSGNFEDELGHTEWCGQCNPMNRGPNDVWTLTVALPPGAYEHKFQVDGWTLAEEVPDACGVRAGQDVNRAFTVSDAPVAVPVTGFSCCAEGCAIDCELGEWGDWGECTGDCGTGSQTRTRSVVVEPSGGGAACGPLTATQSCELLPCHMTSFRFLTIPSQPEIGVTVMNQSYTGGQPIITHSGDNRWRFTLGAYPGTRHGTIRLEDDPSRHLQVDNANDVILASGGGPGSIFRVVPGSAAGTVRIMVSGPVNCGGHSAQICEHCPSGNGAAWCNGDCTWNEAEQACRDDTGECLRFLGGDDNNLSGRQVTVTRAPLDWNW